MNRRGELPGAGRSEDFQITVAACRKRYGSRAGVIGVGAGLKYLAGHPQPDVLCIQFYVRRKHRNPAPEARLPRFVHPRAADGRTDRSRRIPTDVIELGRIRPASGNGLEIVARGEAGTATLVFQNRIPGDRRPYLLTCAHVVGDLRTPVPVDPRIEDRSGKPLAVTLVGSTLRQNLLSHDIALARLHKPAPAGGNGLHGFLDPADIRPGLRLECRFPVSNVLNATVASGRATLPVLIGNRERLVENLFLLDAAPRQGDSGGLLHADGLAAGILVAVAESGWGLFQPLAEAVAHLQSIAPVPFACF